MQNLDDDFQDGFEVTTQSVGSYDLGIPSEIRLVAPHIPDVRVIHDLPMFIDVRSVDLPTLIEVRSLTPIPQEIKLIHNLPQAIELKATDIPTTIFLQNKDVPHFIELRMAEDMPTKLQLEVTGMPESIQLVGAPTTIELVGNIPTAIQLVMPEKPEVEMVWKGDPIGVEVKLTMDKLLGDNDNAQCVAIVPCPKR